jgi:hypothetical protein
VIYYSNAEPREKGNLANLPKTIVKFFNYIKLENGFTALKKSSFNYVLMLHIIEWHVPYSQTCVQKPPLGPENSGRLTEVSDKMKIYVDWLLLNNTGRC